MTDFDPYSEKIADICALIRQHGQCEAWELFKNAENGLEVLCAIVDAVRAEAKAAVPVVPHLVKGQRYDSIHFDWMIYEGDDVYWGEFTHKFRTPYGTRYVKPTQLASHFSTAIAEQTKQQEPK